MTKLDKLTRVPAVTAEEFYNRIAAEDPRPTPEFLTESRPFEGDHYEVPVDRFLSKDYAAKEVEHLWKRVWQVACREEEIPEVGDIYVYEIATLQFIIVRSGPDTIKAYPNSCLHRGRQLVDCNKRATQIRCPFHAFTWDLDGRIASIPCAWEFSHVEDPAKWRLPEAKVETWGGFVFINPDQDSPPLKEFLGDIDRHYERYPLDDRYIAGHARKVVDCNWKIAQEAFMEAFHIIGTHPQLLPQGCHTDMKYDVYGNFSRTLGTYYIPNAFVGYDPSEQDIIDSVSDLREGEERIMTLGEGETARQHMARSAREGFEKVTGSSADQLTDSELVDVCFMSIFPNVHPWTLFNRITYLFRPYKDDPDKAWMDVYILAPFNKEDGRPAAKKVQFLTDEEDWTACTDIAPYLGRIANQDLFNIGPVQQGMKASATGVVNYSHYQESRIRHFHQLLDEWMGDAPPAKPSDIAPVNKFHAE